MREELDEIKARQKARKQAGIPPKVTMEMLYEMQLDILENQARRPVFNALRRQEAEHPIEEVGKKLRSMMGWLKK